VSRDLPGLRPLDRLAILGAEGVAARCRGYRCRCHSGSRALIPGQRRRRQGVARERVLEPDPERPVGRVRQGVGQRAALRPRRLVGAGSRRPAIAAMVHARRRRLGLPGPQLARRCRPRLGVLRKRVASGRAAVRCLPLGVRAPPAPARAEALLLSAAPRRREVPAALRARPPRRRGGVHAGGSRAASAHPRT
jgi:hypothetical protein